MLNTKITFSYFFFTRLLKYAIVLIKQIEYFVYFFLIIQAYSNVKYEVFYINILKINEFDFNKNIIYNQYLCEI